MCGRYQNRAEKQEIAEAFRVARTSDADLRPSYNVAPQTQQWVVRLDRDTGERELTLLRWGFVPFFAKNPQIGYSMINARAETAAASPIFREAMKRRRCLVPATGFYEWQKLGKKATQPWNFELDGGGLFAIAGLWDRWKDSTSGKVLETYTILTTDPNEQVQRVHDRMPVILAPADYDRWLQSEDAERPPVDLLRPFPAEKMRAWKVGADVGSPQNDSPGLRLPTAEEPAAPSLFPVSDG
jgi:putative SOS response-associated peptidase YedK